MGFAVRHRRRLLLLRRDNIASERFLFRSDWRDSNPTTFSMVCFVAVRPTGGQSWDILQRDNTKPLFYRWSQTRKDQVVQAVLLFANSHIMGIIPI